MLMITAFTLVVRVSTPIINEPTPGSELPDRLSFAITPKNVIVVAGKPNQSVQAHVVDYSDERKVSRPGLSEGAQRNR
jgi:hypothetical protein